MKEEVYTFAVTDVERRIVINALSLLKNKQICENKSYECIEDIMLKLCSMETMNKGKKHKYEKER